MMALSIAQAIIPFIAIYGLYKILSFSYKPEQLKSMFKTTWMTAAVLLGITIIIAYGQGLDGPSDAQYTKSGNAQVIPVFKELRSDLLWGDIWRSAIFLVIAIGLVWAGINKKLKAMQIGLILTAVVAIDLIGISSRYLTDEQWVEKEEETWQTVQISRQASKFSFMLFKCSKRFFKMLARRNGYCLPGYEGSFLIVQDFTTAE